MLLSGWNTAVPAIDFAPFAEELHRRGFRTAIVEKFGYGWSDDTKTPRDLDTVMDEIRAALFGAGVQPPWILCGHSMAGTEMVRWSCLHPEEVRCVVSIDAPAPLCYWHVPLPPRAMLWFQRFLRFSGLHRLMMRFPPYARSLDKYMNGFRFLDEKQLAQVRRMQSRNYATRACCGEITRLRQNCARAGDRLPVGMPLLVFVASHTAEKLWDKLEPEESEFLRDNRARRVDVPGLHNLQHYAPVLMAEEIARQMWEGEAAN